MEGSADRWAGRRLAVGPVALLLGVLAVFVLVHMGTTHDLALTDLPASGSHQHVGPAGHGLDTMAATTSASASSGVAADHVDREGGHGERGHDDVLVGCLVALTGLVGGLMLARPRLLRAPSAAGAATATGSFAVVGSRALGALRSPSLATLCVLRT